MKMSDIMSKYTITPSLKQRFCKDMNLPIRIFEEPYFSSRMELYDEHYDCVRKFAEFIALVDKFGGEAGYFEQYSKLKDRVIEYLRENERMVYFSQKEDMNKFSIQNEGYPKSDIFKVTNAGKCFVSIDMVKGNFTALHHYDPMIVGGMETYEDFISIFTDEDYFKDSKYIRQVVFGNVNPRRQVTYEKYLMDKVLTKLFEMGIVSTSKTADGVREDIEPRVVFFSTDEIVISIPDLWVKDGKYTGDTFAKAVESVVEWAKGENINIRAEFFKLKDIKGTEGYVKEFFLNKTGYSFKCLDSLTMPMVLRTMRNELIQSEDLVFIYEGRRAKLLDIPAIEIE